MEHWILVDHGYLNLLHLEATISAENSKAREKEDKVTYCCAFTESIYVQRFRENLILLNKERRDVTTTRTAFKSFHVQRRLLSTCIQHLCALRSQWL